MEFYEYSSLYWLLEKMQDTLSKLKEEKETHPLELVV